MKTSQNTKIYNYLAKGKSLTPIQALDKFGCFRLASRINDLRKQGYTIFTDKVTKNKKTFASYKMVK